MNGVPIWRGADVSDSAGVVYQGQGGRIGRECGSPSRAREPALGLGGLPTGARGLPGPTKKAPCVATRGSELGPPLLLLRACRDKDRIIIIVNGFCVAVLSVTVFFFLDSPISTIGDTDTDMRAMKNATARAADVSDMGGAKLVRTLSMYLLG